MTFDPTGGNSGYTPPGDQGLSAIQSNGVKALSKIAQVLASVFPTISGTSASATAGSATLPANPVGFITVTLPDGTSAKVPYYS